MLAGLTLLTPRLSNIGAKLGVGVFAGIVMGRLFVIGHDACHGSFSRFPQLNKVVATISFLPTLTPLAAWRVAHNQTHHVFTNLAKIDYVWAPFSKAEFDRLPRWRRAAEMIYRHPLGQGLYYCVEIWWRHLLLGPENAGRTAGILIMGASCGTVAIAVSLYGILVGEGIFSAVFFSMSVPFIIWNALMGALIFLQHTGSTIRWYCDEDQWRSTDSQLDAVARIVFPGPWNSVFHNMALQEFEWVAGGTQAKPVVCGRPESRRFTPSTVLPRLDEIKQ